MGIFTKISSHLEMMQDMFRQTGAMPGNGISPLQAASLRQATQRCMSCSKGEACRKWLELGTPETEGLREPPAFCANHSLQEELRRA